MCRGHGVGSDLEILKITRPKTDVEGKLTHQFSYQYNSSYKRRKRATRKTRHHVHECYLTYFNYLRLIHRVLRRCAGMSMLCLCTGSLKPANFNLQNIELGILSQQLSSRPVSVSSRGQ